MNFERSPWLTAAVFNPAVITSAVLAAAVLAAAILGSCSDTRPFPDGGSVVLITADTLRADVVGCYGSTEGHTPNIDALARKGALFVECLAPISTTMPSHATLFTGRYPRFHGVRWNGQELGSRFETLAEIMEERGYDTAAFVAFQSMLRRGGLGQGFRETSPKVRKKSEIYQSRIRSGEEVNTLVMDWLSKRRGPRPFFLWVHYFEPHGPYPITPYAEQAMARAGYDGVLTKGASTEIIIKEGVLNDPAGRAALRALYGGRVRKMDRHVGALMSCMEDRGLLADTTVVFTGDHGQLLGDRSGGVPLFGHGPYIQRKVLAVPLIIKGPMISEPLRITERVGLVDFFPTLLDLLNISVPPDGHGRSLLPAIEGRALDPASYIAETSSPPNDSKQYNAETYRDRIAVYHRNLKVVFPDQRVYDLSRDDPEAHPLPAEEHRTLLDKLDPVARTFLEFRFQTEGDQDLSDEDVDELRALGYLK